MESLPPVLYSQLNGCVLVIPGLKEDGELLVMGEYMEDPSMGRLVLLYYGSFSEMLGGAPRAEWEEEIEETLIHELRHHIESLAGVDHLSAEEPKELRPQAPGEFCRLLRCC